MDYKAAWEDLRGALESIIATHERLVKRHLITETGDASNEAYETVAAYMKNAEERAARPDADADAQA